MLVAKLFLDLPLLLFSVCILLLCYITLNKGIGNTAWLPLKLVFCLVAVKTLYLFSFRVLNFPVLTSENYTCTHKKITLLFQI